MFKFISLLVVPFFTLANTVAVSSGNIFLGEEIYNHKKTGKVCYVQFQMVETLEAKGMHCNKLHLKMGFSTKAENHIKEEIGLYSRITNYHRPEYPAVKSCAEVMTNVPDTLRNQISIYDHDNTYLYNQLFSWEEKKGRTQHHFFVTFSSKNKKPVRAKLHTVSWFSEKDWECVNLKDATPIR